MRACLLTLLAACVVGCAAKKPEDKVVGSWSGDAPIPVGLQNDPTMRQFADMMKDTISLELSEDHRYTLRCWAVKTGTWKLENRRVRFEEKNSESTLPEFFAPLDFGTPGPNGSRNYSAILSADEKQITLVMGRRGDVVFHR